MCKWKMFFLCNSSGNNELKDKIVMCYASIGHVLGIDCDKYVVVF